MGQQINIVCYDHNNNILSLLLLLLLVSVFTSVPHYYAHKLFTASIQKLVVHRVKYISPTPTACNM